MQKTPASIVGFAGRRIDAPDSSQPRFPVSQIDRVYKQITALFIKNECSMLITSAACGADLLALQVAQNLRMRYRIILPFAAERFRMTSVVDRPATKEWSWGTMFDQVVSSAQENGDLVILKTGEDRHAGYQAVNHAILDLAQEQCAIQSKQGETKAAQDFKNIHAVIAWDGHPRGASDLTRHFANEARMRGIVVTEILTLPK